MRTDLENEWNQLIEDYDDELIVLNEWLERGHTIADLEEVSEETYVWALRFGYEHGLISE